MKRAKQVKVENKTLQEMTFEELQERFDYTAKARNFAEGNSLSNPVTIMSLNMSLDRIRNELRRRTS